MPLYDTIGRNYTTTRRPDPRIAARITAALGDARTVLNVGAGAGSYEPSDRTVVAVEPSLVMIAKRPAGAAAAVRAIAEHLPFRDGAFDAAMASLSDHHWTDRVGGLREMRRVANRVVIFQWDSETCWDFWLTRDYLPGFARLLSPGDIDDGAGAPLTIEGIAEVLGGQTRIEPVPVPHDCVDGFYGAFWRRPEAYLDESVRMGISVFARIPQAEVEAAVRRLALDLASGAWAERNREILDLDAFDAGYRIVVAGT